MRPELEQLELIEKYLLGTLNHVDQTAFETELKNNAALSRAVDTQQLLMQAIERKALLKIVEANAPKSSYIAIPSPLKYVKWPIILSVFVIGLLVIWHLFGDQKTVPTQAKVPLKQAVEQAPDIPRDRLTTKRVEQETQNPSRPSKRTEWIATESKVFGGLRTWVTPAVQRVAVNTATSELIECKEGTVIIVPEGTFEDAQGRRVSGAIDLEIIEALTMDKMVQYNLTTTSDGRALRSGGMLYLQASKDGEVLRVRSGKSVHIEIPTDTFDPTMKVWDGRADANGTIAWENPRELERYLTPVSLQSLDFLPDGFRAEVAEILPFANYTKSSKKLEDSLYFALSTFMAESLTAEAPQKENTTSEIEESINEVPITIEMDTAYGSLHLTDLPEGVEFNAELTIGEENIVYPVVNDASFDLISGTIALRLSSANCADFVMPSVQISPEKITLIDCSEISCNRTAVDSLSSQRSENAPCFLDPSSIYAIHQDNYATTFIATRAFQERLQALHRIPNAQRLLELYVKQLDKDLHEIDQMVADELREPYKSIFIAFAAQQLTNVKTNGQDIKMLSDYYSRQLQAKREEERQKRAVYRQKTTQELQALRDELQQLQKNYLTERRHAMNPQRTSGMNFHGKGIRSLKKPQPSGRSIRPQVGRQASYKLNWFGAAWTNIDAYLKELSNGERIVTLEVPEQPNCKIYQSIASLNTMVQLNRVEGRYTARFPKNGRTVFRESIGIGVARLPDNRYALCAAQYDPYTSDRVALSAWKTYSEEEFKQQLARLYPNAERIAQTYKEEDERLRKQWDRRRRAEEERKQRAKILEEITKNFRTQRAALKKKEAALEARQRAAMNFLLHLVRFIDPCAKDQSELNSFGVQAFPAREAEFPGGASAMSEYIADAVIYPTDIPENCENSNVYVAFVVDKEGQVGQARVVKTHPSMVSYSMEQEALRVVSNMPLWSPAEDGGVPVASEITLSIRFTLE